MSCNINGVFWEADSNNIIKQGNTFIITGLDSSGDEIKITIYGTASGNYVESTIIHQFTATLTSNSNVYTTYEGTVTISSVDEINKIVDGSFSFNVKDSNQNIKSITDGIFTSFQYQ
jgi:hypothetical protein